MKKRLYSLVLIILLAFLAGCQSNAPAANEKQPVVYDWMAGESPISDQRTGLRRAGLAGNPFECTDDGSYFIYQAPDGGTYILYGDHGSDSLIKLCGRADCTHDDKDCNAYIAGASQIIYYDGYLYANAGSPLPLQLVRMDLDGSNREIVLDMTQFVADNGYHGITFPALMNGCYFLGLARVDENGEVVSDGYYFRLDGSMDQVEKMNGALPTWNGSSLFLLYTPIAENGGKYGGYQAWDPETNTITYLTDHFGTAGCYGDTEAYYYRDGAFYRLDYATQQEEILFQTGLEGKHNALFFPDCILLSSSEDNIMYIYNWAYELVDQVLLDIPGIESLSDNIIGETAERIILAESQMGLPRYYIEKSDFGTGNIEIHEYNLPDLQEEIAELDAQLSGE